VVERRHDAQTSIWLMTLPPFDVTVLGLGAEAEVGELAEEVVAQLDRAGLEVLYDDRDEGAGVKFNDADLIGIPVRIGVGRCHLGRPAVEWNLRWASQVDVVRLAGLASRVHQTIGRTG
jgi:prolyl-tRNA synthetase